MSEEQQSGQEKSQDASKQKLEKARKKGELPRSQDAQAMVAYIGLALALAIGGAWSMIELGEVLMAFIARPHELVQLVVHGAGAATLGEVLMRVGLVMAPILMLPGVMVVLFLVAKRGIVLAPDKLKPKVSKISPIQNAKQKYGPQGLFEFLKSAVKLTAVGIVLGFVVWADFDRLPGYARIEARHLILLLEQQLWDILAGVMIVWFAIALIDTLWQRHSHLKRMRMTHQEVKDESKQSEGDPHFRAARRERAREIANNRMLHEVPNADVVIVNPTHFAIALKWSRAQQTVPVCVAKGQDEMAKRIRMRAEQSDVPIHEDPPTARSLHAVVEVGHPIEPEHYKAVAAAIVFADKMRAKVREREGG
ncbi:MAG: flagellar type III secretion system protein FlhB [Pseudomonadota bacterium]